MLLQLDGRKVVVTGGFGILGRAVGTLLARRGARVALLDRAAVPDDLDDELRRCALGDIDLVDPQAAADAMRLLSGRLDGIHAVVNVAGGFCWETVEGGAIDTWDRLYAMNLRTAVISTQAALPYLLLAAGMGRVVNVGALAAVKAGLGMGAYAASKAGVMRFTEALAEELKDKGVTVNAVLPSIIDTPANRSDMPGADAGRWVAPQSLAAVIAFLLSEDAAAVTGASLPVAGRV